MPDFGSPVAQNVDINPLRTLGDILSLKQKQVGLQQQQQVLKSETAQAQQQTQTAGQRGALAGFYQHFDPTKHVGTDGTLDLDAVLTDPKIRQAAGDQFPEVMQQMIATKNGQLQTKQQLANLNGTLRDQFSSAVGSLRTDPDVVADNNVGRGKVLDAMHNFGETGGPDAQRIAQTYGSVIQHVPKGNLKDTLSNFQLQAMSAGEQAGRQAPNYAQVDTGPNVEVRNVNPQAAGGDQMPASFRKAPGPTQTIPYVRAASNAGTTGGTEASNDADAYSQIREAGNRSAQIKGLTQEVERLAGDVQTGAKSEGTAKLWSTLSQTLGLPVATATDRRILLGKYAAQLRMQSSANAGTDMARTEIEQAMPNPETMPPEAIKEAARYIRGTADVSAARLRNADKFQKSNGSVNGLRSTDNDFMRNADPRVFQYKGLAPGPERQAFLREHFTDKNGKPDAQAVNEFLAKANALTHHGAFDGQ